MKHGLLLLAAVLVSACSYQTTADAEPGCSIEQKTCGKSVVDYESCIAAGNKVLKTFPPRCMAADGKVYQKDVLKKVEGDLPPLKSICLNKCGNGNCEEIVCMGSGCPCPESKQSCPEDCK